MLNVAKEVAAMERMLFLTPTETGRVTLSEHDLRPIAAITDWAKQRRLWRAH